jgi:DNA-binding transcriptional ArsR family regulator
VTDKRKTGMAEKLMWDLLPEEFPYEDKGCELFPSCLNCPFPDCLKEEPWGKERFLKRRRAERMLELKREGKSVREIARIFEVSPRTVQRWLKAVEAASPCPVERGRDSLFRPGRTRESPGAADGRDCHAPFGCSQ